MYYLAISAFSIGSLSGLISEVTLKCGHLANQATMHVPKGGWNRQEFTVFHFFVVK